MRADNLATGPLLRVRATHLLLGVSSPQEGDALAVVDGDGSEPARRVFVPSPLPCGECPICRRALVSACPNLRPGLSVAEPRGEIPERFVTPISEPAWAALPSETLAAAGLVAEIIDATARAGLGPGDTAVWLGDEPFVSLGAAYSARRSCRTFCLTDRTTPPATAAEGSEAIVLLSPRETPQSWSAAIIAAESASGSGDGRPERRIFVYSAAPSAADAALQLATPGSTLSFRRGAPASLGVVDRVSPLRLLIGGGYHPDLIPEALAALARKDVDVAPLIVASPNRPGVLALVG